MKFLLLIPQIINYRFIFCQKKNIYINVKNLDTTTVLKADYYHKNLIKKLKRKKHPL